MARSTRVGETDTEGPHDPDAPLGRALARADYSELRLHQLLNSRGLTLRTTVEQTAHLLNGKQQKFNWPEAAALLMTTYRDKGQQDSDRMRIARAYYRESHEE